MLFWIVAAVMTAAVVMLIVPPLLKSQATGPDARADFDLEVYRDQLAELERDQARGLISETQAAAAKAEIGRRMLAIADHKGSTSQPAAAPRSGKVLAGLLVLALPLGALAVYGKLGRPELPAQPLASRDLNQERGAPPKNVLAALEKLKAQLDQNPDDAQGWSILGQAYAKMGRVQEAADALRKAATLSKGDPDILGTYGEVLISAAGGTVTEEARTAFETILTKDAKEPRARFYLALARRQAGDVKGALERWAALLGDSPADAPWVPVVQGQIQQAAKELGLDPAAVTPKTLPPEQPPAAQNQNPGQGQDQAGSPEDRDQMIRGMVANLAAKLEANPADVDGWLKLARSYNVLGERDKAAEAARKAKEQAPDRPDVLVAYAGALLSLEPPTDKPGPMPAEAVTALRQALTVEPTNRDALWLLGLDAADTGRTAEASDLWTRLLAQFQPNDPEYALIRARLESLKAGG
ncbi:c-type cytochrome biogenesis protein CcmI [Azospirillum rugosum]|uniref:Cytochrome c-type biogenesis protein CcmH n=1 Tax=Azospirillum rugosum TaxID=416170 RepID=A0ABS4SVP4_9PROT|nr:c-type cytochrome biogenesis protein CcmI [Azospirillum rugosum]MBP2296638.1 cytochrome c-type biogenesis protein CcmH [Azospirillum rugosum]MDQ0530303.1 cytochrome c-type biogenesis protein CcmH [Azospirillum rugosum]